MKPALLFCLLLTLPPGFLGVLAAEDRATPPLPQGQSFASNELGLRLRELDPGQEEPGDYLLVVTVGAGQEISRLYYRGEEIKRWEASDREERLYVRGRLKETRRFDSAGRLVEELTYEDDAGRLARRVVYRYGEDGLEAAETYDGEDDLLYTDLYRLSGQGRLLEVRRVGTEEPLRLSFRGREGRVTEELSSRGGEEYLYRYDGRGRFLGKEVWRDGEPVSRERYSYAGQEPDAGPGRVSPGIVSRVLDERDRVVKQILYSEGERIEESIFYDEDDRKVRLVRSSSRGLEETLYSYTDSGVLSREEYRLKGRLKQVILYQEEGLRVSEFYREGGLFLRVTYQNDRPIREELIEEGQVVDIRELAE